MRNTSQVSKTYGENIVNKFMTFDSTATWNITAGSGSAEHSTEQVFNGTKGLKISNIDVSKPLTTNYTTTSIGTTINTNGNYFISFYVMNSQDEEITGRCRIYKNAVLDQNIEFTVTADDEDKYIQFFGYFPYSATDELTYDFVVDANSGSAYASNTIYIDGFGIYQDNRDLVYPPYYVKPFESNQITVSYPVILPFTFPENAKTDQDSLHGGLRQTGSQSGIVLNSGQTITDTIGISKIFLLINAGTDLAGDITITGTSVDRNTGVETASDTDIIPITALSTDSSTTDANGNPVYSIVGGYISSKWFKGAITLSTTDVDLTDIDIYQVAFDQFNDSESITVNTLDATYITENTTCELDCYLYAVEVSGSVCDITLLATLTHETGQSINFYRKRIGHISKELDGTKEGVFVDLYTLPASQTYFSGVSLNVWATKEEKINII